MAETSKAGAKTAAVVILALVAAANLGYGVYRMLNGAEDSLPLLIGGLVCATLAVVPLATGKRYNGR